MAPAAWVGFACLEVKLQTELELPGALRAGNLSKDRAAGIEGAAGRTCGEGEHLVVEGVERFEAELQLTRFPYWALLMYTQNGIRVTRPSNVSSRAGSESIRGS